MTEVVIANPRRVRHGGSLGPDDFPDVAGCVHVAWSGSALVVGFDCELSPEQVETVRLRGESTGPDDETLRRKARAALAANRDFLALPNPSNAQAVAQVQALTRQVTALARIVLQHHDET